MLSYNGTEWVPMTLPEAVAGSVMIGASNDTAGTAGLVPAPKAGDQNKFLRGDGTWAEVTGGNVDLTGYAKIEVTDALDTRVTTLENEQEDMTGALTWGTI